MYKISNHLDKLVLIKYGDNRDNDKHQKPEFYFRWCLVSYKDIKINPLNLPYQGIRDFEYIVDESICS